MKSKERQATAWFYAESVGVARRLYKKPLTIQEILAWADAHFARTGAWPIARSGDIEGADGLNWYAVNTALRRGTRGLPGGSTLARFLAHHRQVRNKKGSPLDVVTILEWARLHEQRTGKPPLSSSGPVADAPGESWNSINLALGQGLRKLPGGSSLSKLLAEHRSKGATATNLARLARPTPKRFNP